MDSDANCPVAVQILMETGLIRLQCRAGSRQYGGASEIVTAAVGIPDRILIGARDLPGNFKTCCCLLRTDRRPRAELTPPHRPAAIFQRTDRSRGVTIKIAI